MTFVNVCDAPALAAGLRSHPLLHSLPQSTLEDLCSGATRQRLAPGSTAFHEGDEATHCLWIEAGAIEVLRFSDDGDERVFHRFAPGQLVAEAAMFMAHGRYPMTARADGATIAWQLPRTSVRNACLQHPPLAMRFLENLSQRLYRRINEVEWLTASTAQQRLAAYLLNLRQQGPSTVVDLPCSQRQLATHLGIRAETLSRVLADWQQRGWIGGERRRWNLLQTDTLERLTAASHRPF
jgi:CRP-like cAMP-binding protein